MKQVTWSVQWGPLANKHRKTGDQMTSARRVEEASWEYYAAEKIAIGPEEETKRHVAIRLHCLPEEPGSWEMGC